MLDRKFTRPIQIGDRFGRLTVKSGPIYKAVMRDGRATRKYRAWICACACGTTRAFSQDSLRCRAGSCGCLKNEQASQRATARNMRA